MKSASSFFFVKNLTWDWESIKKLSLPETDISSKIKPLLRALKK
jgi:hypothetical protein